MDVLLAKRGDRYYYTWDGYIYLANKKHSNKMYVKCHNTKCSAGGHFVVDAARGQGITMRKVKHSHGPDYKFIEDMQFRHELRRIAQRSPDLPLKLIYQEAATKYPQASQRFTLKGAKGMLLRHKRNLQYQILVTAVDDFNEQDCGHASPDGTEKTREDFEQMISKHKENEDVQLMFVGETKDEIYQSEEEEIPSLEEPEGTPTDELADTTDLVNEPEQMDQDMETRLQRLLIQLEATSARLTSAGSKNDSFDSFGNYIASLLRGLPLTTVVKLKQNIIQTILTAKIAEEQVPAMSRPSGTLRTPTKDITGHLRTTNTGSFVGGSSAKRRNLAKIEQHKIKRRPKRNNSTQFKSRTISSSQEWDVLNGVTGDQADLNDGSDEEASDSDAEEGAKVLNCDNKSDDEEISNPKSKV